MRLFPGCLPVRRSLSSGILIHSVISNFFVDDFYEPIEPRPLEPGILPRPITGWAIEPRPVKSREQREIAPKGTVEQDGPTQADILLQAIVLVARRDPPNHAALRTLCVRFSREHALDF
jgi:hypothetical protein